MAKIKREEAIEAALNLSMRWGWTGGDTKPSPETWRQIRHALLAFKNKAELLNEMSAAITARGHLLAVPQSRAEWHTWLAENARSFRRALLAYRDGARIHAGTEPSTAELENIAGKVAYLVRVGIPERHASMVLYSMGQFTIGCILEKQARFVPVGAPTEDDSRETNPSVSEVHLSKLVKTTTAEMAFEYGIGLLLDGLERQTEETRKTLRRKD